MPKRKLKISGNIHTKDYEVWPDTDERCNLPIDREIIIENPIYATILTEKLKCGGECRTELDIQAKVLSNGEVLANIDSRFYEGGSADTTELEDTESHRDVLIKRSSSTNVNQHLVNVDIPGDDESWIGLTFTNFPLED